MENKILINNKAVHVSDTKVQFGAISAPTPLWATWVFRGWTIFTTALAFYIAGTSLVNPAAQKEVLLAIKASDLLVLGLSKLFGIVEK